MPVCLDNPAGIDTEGTPPSVAGPVWRITRVNSAYAASEGRSCPLSVTSGASH
ncbi:Uncharacterised protein [Burkholderia pseudomallei]|nr:Uncharacterised protein [Burkholderia pseudomallei]